MSTPLLWVGVSIQPATVAVFTWRLRNYRPRIIKRRHGGVILLGALVGGIYTQGNSVSLRLQGPGPRLEPFLLGLPPQTNNLLSTEFAFLPERGQSKGHDINGVESLGKDATNAERRFRIRCSLS